MPEPNAYFDGIIAARSLLVNQDDAFAGMETISLETQGDLTEQGIDIYIRENFTSFLKFARLLSRQDFDLLTGYFLLGRSQAALADDHSAAQTNVSTYLRLASRRVCCLILFNGKPSAAQMAPVLTKAGLENLLPVPLSAVVFAYERCRSFETVASSYHLHRAAVRRVMRDAAKKLLESEDVKQETLGAYIHALVDRASAAGVGVIARRQDRASNMFVVLPAVLGQFRVDVQHPDFDSVLSSRGRE